MLAAVGPLFQLRPSVTVPVLGLTAVLRTEITRIVICNPTGSEVDFSLYHRVGGGLTFDATVALIFANPVPANYTVLVDAPAGNVGFGMQIDDTFAVQASVIDSLVFTAYGNTADVAQRAASI